MKINQMKFVFSILVFLLGGSSTLPVQGGLLPKTVLPEWKCDWNCTREHKPLCAGKGKGTPRTFENLCFLNAFNCNMENEDVLHVIREGECAPADARTLNLKQCHKCQSNERPACAKSKCGTKTFYNLCFMALENCEMEYNKKKRFQYLHDGPC